MKYEFDESRKAIAQGDCYLIPIKSVPADALVKPVAAENGALVVAHSETGHHHVVKEGDEETGTAVAMYQGTSMFQDFLQVTGGSTEIEHLRDYDTHAPQVIEEGAWLVQRQVGYQPQAVLMTIARD